MVRFSVDHSRMEAMARRHEDSHSASDKVLFVVCLLLLLASPFVGIVVMLAVSATMGEPFDGLVPLIVGTVLVVVASGLPCGLYLRRHPSPFGPPDESWMGSAGLVLDWPFLVYVHHQHVINIDYVDSDLCSVAVCDLSQPGSGVRLDAGGYAWVVAGDVSEVDADIQHVRPYAGMSGHATDAMGILAFVSGSFGLSQQDVMRKAELRIPAVFSPDLARVVAEESRRRGG